MSKITFIDETEIANKRILLRVDFNVSVDKSNHIADDFRIRRSLPTIKHLLEKGNRLIIVSHLGKPKGRDPKHSLKPVIEDLQKYLPDYKIMLVDNFLETPVVNPSEKEIIVLENIRFYPEEKVGDQNFAKKLAALAEIYVNDAFGVCHRSNSSVVAITEFLPSYGGLLLKREIEMISKVTDSPEKPLIVIVGGIKEDKMKFVNKLKSVADQILIGSGMIKYFEKDEKIIFPEDFIVENGEIKKKEELTDEDKPFDIGPETEAVFGSHISSAKTVIWAGPVGYFEDPRFRRGTEFIYYSITQNTNSYSIVGGGDTLSAISKEEYLDKITHISTGGGAMLEYIEHGTLPGLEALKK